MHERKCLACGTWQKADTHCTNCGAVIDPEEQRRLDIKKRVEEEESREKSKFELYLERLKNHRFWIVRAFYSFLYGVSLVFGVFGALLAWATALANG